jgi:hypothetical protein
LPRRLALPLALALVALAVGAFLLLSGGKDTVPLSTISDAAEATNNAGGFKLTVDGSVEGAGPGSAARLEGSGALDPRTRRGRLVFDSAGPLTPAGGAGAGGKVEQIFIGDVIYMRTPTVAQRLGAKRAWLRIDLPSTGRALGIDPTQFGQFGSNDPRRLLDQIRSVSGEVEKLGGEKVRGVDTTRYRAKVDVRKYPDRLPEAQREQARVAVERIVDLTGSSSYPITLWIDDDELVRRMRTEYEFKMPGRKEPAAYTLTMELFDFGSPVGVEPPPAKDVQDLLDLARSAPPRGGTP